MKKRPQSWLARRDQMERAGRRDRRAAHRSCMPQFLDNEETEGDTMDNELSAMRTRRRYEERQDIDDINGIEEVC